MLKNGSFQLRMFARYWQTAQTGANTGVFKTRLKKEGIELTTNCSQLKIQVALFIYMLVVHRHIILLD